MKKLCAAWVVLASCAGNPQHDSVRRAFQEWREALVAGDAEKTFQMMSQGLKAQWLFDRLNAADFESREWRRTLTGVPRTDLDLWYEFNRSRPSPRVAGLPVTVAQHPSFQDLYRRYFMAELAAVRQGYSTIQLAEVYVDSTGATVTMRSPSGSTNMLELIPEGDGWKINHLSRPIQHLPR